MCHITPCDRLPSIFRCGAILSLNERKRRGIAEPQYQHYWGATGRKEALAEYVCCAFMPPWGMFEKHGEEFAILVLDAASICTRDGTLFCPTNTAKSVFAIEEIQNMSGVAALDACFVHSDFPRVRRQTHKQTEILVPGTIPLRRVLAIVFCDQQAHDYWKPKLAPASILAQVTFWMSGPSFAVRQFDRFRFPDDYVVQRRVRQ